jgi:hypothetical protein
MKEGVRTRPAASPVEDQIVFVIDDDPDMRGCAWQVVPFSGAARRSVRIRSRVIATKDRHVVEGPSRTGVTRSDRLLADY